jgi:transketolase
VLAIDAVQAANSGHPGLPMGMADAAYVLWTRFLKHNPRDPHWPDRDRFVLSAGHGSMLIYSLLYLTGYDLPLDELKRFRQWGSKTPGHPEYEITPGVETTTGPLGQGFANGVGMAIAARHLASTYNRPGLSLVDHYIYAICSDGDLMEGVSHEAASLAGHLRLGNLIYLYDDNHITIDGPTELSYSDDVPKRFEAYGWHVQQIDGHDMDAVAAAIEAAQAVTDRPSLISCRTIIGKGMPNRQGTQKAHSDAPGEEEQRLTKEALGLPQELFYVPDDVLQNMRSAVERGAQQQAEWQQLWERYRESEPVLARNWEIAWSNQLPDGWEEALPRWEADAKGIATRAASGKVLEALIPRIPQLLGGSADLTPSNNTRTKDMTDIEPEEFGGRYVRFGVREHAMGAGMNGIALHGGVLPYGGTFLTFSDYMRPAVRLAALMRTHVLFIFTHDSIGLGEDGPTHQPVEHLAALRAIPDLVVIRPADANETAAAWKFALRHAGPVAFALTRQNVPVLEQTGDGAAENVLRGGYILDDEPNPEVVLIGTGSEVALAVEAAELLRPRGVRVRVVSLPCWELFAQQEQSYRDEVLPPDIPARVGVEAAVPLGWDRWLGPQGAFVGVHEFGASAPYKQIFEHRGITAEHVAKEALRLLGREDEPVGDAPIPGNQPPGEGSS